MSTKEQKLAVVEHEEMSVSQVINQVRKIQQIMKSVMRENEHYGIIPGTPKPTLYKPGAEKLGLTFLLKPEFEILQRIDLPDGHREYEIKCRLIHTPSGVIQGEGVGSCSTLESKYRYRWDNTGQSVPSDYWKHRDQSLLGGDNFVARKKDEKWFIFQRIDYDNPADYYNTVLKIAKKRAHIDAMLTATAASDIFTQDEEDLAEVPGDKTGVKLDFRQKKIFIGNMILKITNGDKSKAEEYLKELTRSKKEPKKYPGIKTVNKIASEKQTDFLIGKIEKEFKEKFGIDEYEFLKTKSTDIQMPQSTDDEEATPGEQGTGEDLQGLLTTLTDWHNAHSDKLKGKEKEDYLKFFKGEKKNVAEIQRWIIRLKSFEKEPTML